MARDDAELAQLAARITALRGQTSKSALAHQIRYDRTAITRAEQGEIVPSGGLLATLDRYWGTGGELVARRRRVIGEQVVGEQGVGATDRREALRGLALGALAAEISRRIGRADPDALTIDEYEADVYRIAESYPSTAPARSVEQLAPRWHTIEEMLDSRVSPRVRSRLTSIAGQSAFYLGLAAFDTADDGTARRFFALADYHAGHIGDDLLAGSVAAMRSSVAYFNGAYPVAADIARSARQKAHAFNRPTLAGAEARAAALAGRPDDALSALNDLQDNVWDAGFLPGAGPGDAGFAHAFHATTLTGLGRGEQAEEHARTALRIDTIDRPDATDAISGDWKCLARALLRRQQPDPDGAADALSNALSTLKSHGRVGNVRQIAQTWQEMNARWPGLAGVERVGETLTTLSAQQAAA